MLGSLPESRATRVTRPKSRKRTPTIKNTFGLVPAFNFSYWLLARHARAWLRWSRNMRILALPDPGAPSSGRWTERKSGDLLGKSRDIVPCRAYTWDG